jgi:hypothetical protein
MKKSLYTQKRVPIRTRFQIIYILRKKNDMFPKIEGHYNKLIIIVQYQSIAAEQKNLLF